MKLTANRAWLPGKEIFIYIVPLIPVYKTRLTEHVPAKRLILTFVLWTFEFV